MELNKQTNFLDDIKNDIENSGDGVGSIMINGIDVEPGKPLPLIKEEGKPNTVKVKLI